jgi:hypothetical protein
MDKEIYFNKLNASGRKINIKRYINISFLDNYMYYPDIKFISHINTGNIIKPINEEIQSLKTLNQKEKKINYNMKSNYTNYLEPLFFMIYNFDNYYHYLYDTLPYLISYLKLKESIPNLKLLCNLPNKDKKEFYPFNLEFLNLLGIFKQDIIIVNSNTIYQTIWVSDSFTHGGFSNNRPNIEIFDLYDRIKQNALKNQCNISKYKNIYISRRSHLHNNQNNIGTNYTQRRKLMNEDQLVEILEGLNYKEIFTENLSTIEKIHLFSNAKNIIGCIGGGIANVLFSEKKTNLYAIISPYFLDINYRFKYCLERVNVKYIKNTYHTEQTEFKNYMRVQDKNTNIVGEIYGIDKEYVKINYKNDTISGWNSRTNYLNKYIKKKDCIKLDQGLNSNFILDTNKLLDNIKIKRAIVCFNQGWTDIILCIGLVFYYLDTYDQIILLIREDSKEMIDFIFRNYSKVKLLYHKLSDLDNLDFRLQLLKYYECDYELLLHGSYGYNYGCYQNIIINNKKGTSEHFYTDYKINSNLSFKNFNIDRNYILENQKYDKLIKNIGKDYVVVYNDTERNIILNNKYIYDLPQFNLNKCSKICFDIIKIIENAKEIHLFSSFWALIIYNLQKRYNLFYKNKIYFHEYVRPNYYTELYENNTWNIINHYKTAVCLVGGLRDDTYKNFERDKIIENLNRCYDLSDKNTDIFIFNNCDSKINNKLKAYFGNKIKFIQSYQNKKLFYDQDIANIKNKLNKNYNETSKKFNDWLLKNKENLINYSDHVPFKKDNWEIPKFLSYHQYYHLFQALNQINEYENKNNFKYDFIMKIRMDFFLKEHTFSPNSYFNNYNNILFKNYDNINSLYKCLEIEDEYDANEFRINNYLYYRSTKYLGGQYIKNKKSYQQIKNLLENRKEFNNKIKSKFFININDACFFSNRDNFIKVIFNLFYNFGTYFDSEVKFWWTTEAQLQLSILKNQCYYLDYLQNNNYYYGINMWFDSIHGCEKYII